MTRTFLLIFCVLTSGLSMSAQSPQAPTPPNPPQKHQVVTAAQANGVYRYYKNVYARGTYRKIRSGRPKFESPP